jgi:hypothetical protein
LQSNNLPTLRRRHIWSERCTSQAQRARRHPFWLELLFKFPSKGFSYSIVDVQPWCDRNPCSVKAHAPLLPPNFRRTRKWNSQVPRSRKDSYIHKE